MSLEKCNIEYLSKDYGLAIRDLGQKWRKDKNNPVNDPQFLSSVEAWNLCIAKWASDPNIPLLIRKRDKKLGSINIHTSGRKLVPVDNSPAQWAFACACNGISPPTSIINDLTRGTIPIAMVLPKLNPETISEATAFKGKLHSCPNTQEYGWCLGHKIDVGLKRKMFDCTLDELQEHFIRLMSPSNMFVVPKEKKFRGLAELADFIKEQ